MLIDSKGRVYDPKKLPRDRKARETVLAGLREVQYVPPKHGSMFTLGERFKWKE